MSEKHTPLSSLGEFGLIDHLTNSFETKQQSTIKGIGDDAAVINHEGMCTVLSTDLLIEGVHFDLSFMPLKHLGYKAVIVNLSDIYAMNASPSQITISLAISNRFSVEALDELYAGIKHACDTYGVDLVGGDTTSSSTGLSISVTAVGAAKKKDLVYRNGAKEGDFICVSGELGGAYIGLQLLNREKEVFLENPKMQPKLDEHKYLVGRQLKPEARKDVIAYLRDFDIHPTAMIDVSDGLSSDLMHLCRQADVGCHVYEANVPINNETYNQALEFNMDPITTALSGGEDYELLFTVSPSDESKLNGQEIDITVIGKIVAKEEGLMLQTRANHLHELVAQGWNSFQK
ncbi:MAG: thiamine-phosphate kinase [Chitinophagales bacterium]|nr:thiamine-phosphate kinase [Chitinophagales bacterium]